MPVTQFGLWAAILLGVVVLVLAWQHAQGTQAIISMIGGSGSSAAQNSGAVPNGQNVVALYPQINVAPAAAGYANAWAARAAGQPAIGYPV